MQPYVTLTEGELSIVCSLNNQSEAIVNCYVGTFEYPYYGENAQTYAARQEMFANNLQTYASRVSILPLDTFDYRQAIACLKADYIALRDHSQIPRFAKDSMFSLTYISEEVALFQVHRFNPPYP